MSADFHPCSSCSACAGGAILESDYPYVAQNAYCKDTKLPKAAVFKGYMEVPARDEKALMEAVALHGPVAISFDAGHIDFKWVASLCVVCTSTWGGFSCTVSAYGRHRW